MVDAILKKNLQYIENELKALKSVDYRKFREADVWLQQAKTKLDNFQTNENNPNYIAFDMLTNTKNNQVIDELAEDNLLMDEEHKNIDIIVHGEKIHEFLGHVKTINTNLLASQLTKLNLVFDDTMLDSLENFCKCTSIEGVEIQQEEFEALQEAANAGMETSSPTVVTN